MEAGLAAAGCLKVFWRERGWMRARVGGCVRAGSLRSCLQPLVGPGALVVGTVFGGGRSVHVRPLVFGARGVVSVILCPMRRVVFSGGGHCVSHSSGSPGKSAILEFVHLSSLAGTSILLASLASVFSELFLDFCLYPLPSP